MSAVAIRPGAFRPSSPSDAAGDPSPIALWRIASPSHNPGPVADLVGETGMKVLIAEDQCLASRLLGSLLRSWGYEPVHVADGWSALAALLAADAPPLALLDWVMPGLDGMEVCRRVRKEASTYPYLVLLTGVGGRQEMLEGLEAGADDFLTKPIDPDELRARLNAARRIVQRQAHLLATQQSLREQATHDPLTGLWNRAAILDILDQELARGRRERRPLGLLLADLDHFKRINDTRGHLAGDRLLCEVARRMGEVVRPYDAIGRYGGEEFVVVLPGCELDAAAALAERLRRHVSATPVELEDGPVGVTLSLGVTAWAPDSAAGTVELLRSADASLYHAKDSGRNRVAAGKDLIPGG